MKNIILRIEGIIDDISGSNLLISLLMIVAAWASYGNVFAFFSEGHTNTTTANALAITLGVALVVASSRLSKLDFTRVKRDRDMQIVVGIAATLAIVSGIIQSHEYAKHYDLLIAYVLGFGIPLLLEVAPAATIALLKSIDSNQRTETLRRNVEERMAQTLNDAVERIDISTVNSEIEAAARLFTQESVNNIFGELFHRLQEASDHKLTDYIDLDQPLASLDQQLHPLINDDQGDQPLDQPLASLDQELQKDDDPTCNDIAMELHAAGVECNEAYTQLQAYDCSLQDIARALRCAGYTGAAIARAMGKDPATISRWVKA